MDSMIFEDQLAEGAAKVDQALDALLAADRIGSGRLQEAMRYAVLGGGKRLRPYVVLSSATLFGVGQAEAVRTACALECVHAYSLVHDDLPAMDNDDMRRGRPTAHRAFDEATAILAGDALLTYSFEILGDPATHPEADVRAQLVLELARAAGTAGMVGGQMLDLQAEREHPGEEGTIRLQRMKTAALFRFAALAGAILGGAGPQDRQRLQGFGNALGFAFQIADDLLDEEASAEELGKATAKDRDRGKATLPAIIGARDSRQRLETLVEEAKEALRPYGAAATALAAAAEFAAGRRR